jgi:hypothetical protein
MKKVKNMTDLKFQIVYTPANYTNLPGRESPGAHSKLLPVGVPTNRGGLPWAVSPPPT